MTREGIQGVITNGSIKLSIIQMFSHYLVVVYLVLVPGYVWIDAFRDKTEDYDLLFGGAWTVAAVCFYFVQKRRLRFKIIKFPTTSATFNHAVDLTAKQLSWKITRISSDMVIGYVCRFLWNE
jgi:hypothetical protein